MPKLNSNLLYSVIDQSAVSAGNFLTIVLGAKYLSVADQGKLVYLYSIYIGIVLVNISAFFNSANIVHQEFKSGACYKKILFYTQVGLAALFCGVIAIWLLSSTINKQWIPTWTEAVLACGFIFCQQISDFYRRSGYVFDYIACACRSSLWVYGSRILGMLIFQPSTLTEFLWVMTLPSVPILVVCLYTQYKNFRLKCNKNEVQAIINKHTQLSKWNVANSPLKWAGLHLPIILVAALHSIEAAAILGSIRAITTFANVFLELFETYIPSWLTQRHAENSQSLSSHCFDLLKMGTTFWLIGIIGIFFWGTSIVGLILGEFYVQYTFILYVSWLAVGLSFVGRVISLYYRITQDVIVEFVGSSFGLLVMLACIGVLQKGGAIAGAWILVIFQLSSLTGMFVYRKYKTHGK
jgi:O-antigen/teichoic acid export membrane protein